MDFNPLVFISVSPLSPTSLKKGALPVPTVSSSETEILISVCLHILLILRFPQNHFLLDLEHSSICCQTSFLPTRYLVHVVGFLAVKTWLSWNLALLEPCLDYTPLCRNMSVPSLLDAKHCLSEQSIHSWATFTLYWPHIGQYKVITDVQHFDLEKLLES